jgi:hypothetical protein
LFHIITKDRGDEHGIALQMRKKWKDDNGTRCKKCLMGITVDQVAFELLIIERSLGR